MSWYKVHSERCMAEIAQGRGVAIVPGKHNRAMVEAQRRRGERKGTPWRCSVASHPLAAQRAG